MTEITSTSHKYILTDLKQSSKEQSAVTKVGKEMLIVTNKETCEPDCKQTLTVGKRQDLVPRL